MLSTKYMCLYSLFQLQLLSINGDLHHRKDLAIVLDSSTSIRRDVYESSIGFIYDLVAYMSISPSTTRLALITFASKATLEFSFEKCVNRECIHKKLSSLVKRRKGGRTNIDEALKKAIYLFKTFKGFANKKVLYILSDGKWNEGRTAAHSIRMLQQLGIELRVFGIGSGENEQTLRELLIRFWCKDCYIKLTADYRERSEILKILTGREVDAVKCTGRVVYDECDRECACVDGRMRDCFRVRKEFTSLSNEEKKRYLQAYYRITTEEPLKSRFVKFIKKHHAWFFKGIHVRDQFFPWHRWYVYEFENMMREVDCRITVPYWDWSYWSNVAWEIGLHIWTDDEYGFGGNGMKSENYCVQTGPFNSSGWFHPAPEQTKEIMLAIGEILGNCSAIQEAESRKFSRKCLRRSFNNAPPNLAHVLQTIAMPCDQFIKFEKIVRAGYHNKIHNNIGGEMCTDFAANAPEFFLHHTFLDFIWVRWQNKSPVCKKAYFVEKPWKLIDSPFWTNDFVDSFNQGEYVKVVYDDLSKRTIMPGEYIGEPIDGTEAKTLTCQGVDQLLSYDMPHAAFSVLRENEAKETLEEQRQKLWDDLNYLKIELENF